MEAFNLIAPSLQLQPFIRYYWFYEGTAQPENNATRVLPTGSIEVTFHLGNRLTNLKDGQVEDQPLVLVCGQHSRYFDVMSQGLVRMISIYFKPHGARVFFQMPMQEVENQTVALTEFWLAEVVELQEKLFYCRNEGEAICFIELYLMKKLQEKKYYDFKRLDQAVRHINYNKGKISLDELAEITCWSSKQFERQFSSFVGMKPKKFLRMVRFQAALYRFQRQGFNSLTELAHHCGYYDQSHFINDFKLLSGYTPSQFFKNQDVYSDYFTEA
ncbi:MAG: DUF6597 domain-containing transcriptional factor [Candidatus Cyclobacteriaceae bacterium M3_2C_046]